MVLEVDHVSTAATGAVDEDVEPHKLDRRAIEATFFDPAANRGAEERRIGHVDRSAQVQFDDVVHAFEV